MGNRYIRCYEELKIKNIGLNNVGLQIDFIPVNGDVSIRVIIFTPNKENEFEQNYQQLLKMHREDIILNTIHDDITSEESVVAFYWNEGEKRNRIFFSTKKRGGLEFLYSS